MLIFRFFMISTFFLSNSFLYASETGMIPLGEVSKNNLIFNVPTPIDLRNCAQELKSIEEDLTNQLIPLLEDDEFVRNLSFGGFVLCRPEKDPQLLPFKDSNKTIAFESGQKSCFLEMQSKILRKSSIRSSLKSQDLIFEKFYFGKYMQRNNTKEKSSEDQKMSRLEEQDTILKSVCSHCNYFWDLDQLDEEEKIYYQSNSSYASGISAFSKFITQKAEIKKIVSKLVATLDTFGDEGMVHKDALKLNDRLEKTKKLLKSTCDTADKSILRWCSEQKVLHDLYINEGSWQDLLKSEHSKEALSACFLLIHTYQDPCPSCRMTFIRAMKKLFQPFFEENLRIPFHMVITSREKYFVFPSKPTPENITGEEADTKALEFVNTWDFDHNLLYSISLRKVS